MAALQNMRGAFSLLTVVPGGTAGSAPTPRVSAWFPWVGVLLGAVALGVLTAVDAASGAWGDGRFLARAAWPIAVVIVVGWAALTRLLHWDGLADVADGWWGGATAERRLEIMADSSVGAFGATAVALAVIAQVGSVAVLVGQAGFCVAVFAAPVFARGAAAFGAWLGTPARPGGLGARVVGRPRLTDMLVASAALGLAGAAMLHAHGTPGIVWSAAAVVLSVGVPHVISRRFGGVTGDVLGASVLVTEAACLGAAALVAAW